MKTNCVSGGVKFGKRIFHCCYTRRMSSLTLAYLPSIYLYGLELPYYLQRFRLHQIPREYWIRKQPFCRRSVSSTCRTCQQTARKTCDSLNEDSIFKPSSSYLKPRLTLGPLWVHGTIPIRTGQTAPVSKLLTQYAGLAKVRLSALVVITASFGYLMAPYPFTLAPLASCCLGTFLLAASANGFNQISEVAFDARMKRTKARPLVMGRIGLLHGKIVCTTAGLLGGAALYFGNNLLTATLGLSNLALYALLYTSMKRTSIYNTWIGSVVGAIPPLIGWAAICDSLDMGGFLIATLLYCWQFPHFNALSWNLRKDYIKGGYRMACNERPNLCCASTIRHSMALLLLCSVAMPYAGLTTWTFAVDSLPLNAYFVYLSYKFYADRDSSSARKLFRFSLIYLPVILMFMYISKADWAVSAPDAAAGELVA